MGETLSDFVHSDSLDRVFFGLFDVLFLGFWPLDFSWVRGKLRLPKVGRLVACVSLVGQVLASLCQAPASFRQELVSFRQELVSCRQEPCRSQEQYFW